MTALPPIASLGVDLPLNPPAPLREVSHEEVQRRAQEFAKAFAHYAETVKLYESERGMSNSAASYFAANAARNLSEDTYHDFVTES